MKRTAMAAGVSVTALLCAWTAGADAAPFTQSQSSSTFGFFNRQPYESPYRRPDSRPDNRFEKKAKPDADGRHGKAALSEADKAPPVPKGLLHIIVSLDKQRATLFADGVEIAQSKISSGTPEHPTPLGVFSVLQKSRHHVSNLYDAPMPFMQRITWSGSALHEGPLPGYPASHGCVRLPNEFAQVLWKTTKLGARVIIARDEAAPVAIEHERLIFAKAKASDAPAPQPEPAVKPDTVPNTAPKPDPRPDLISEPKAPPARDSEPVAAKPAPLLKTVDASPTLRGTIPDTAKPFVAATVRNGVAGEQATKLIRTEEADDLAMPAMPATTGTTAAPARVPVAETMARADVPLKAAIVETAPAPVPAPAAVLPVKETSPNVVAPAASAAPTVAAKEPPRRKGVVSMFISLKEQKLYVRQNMEPLFTAPVTIARPGEPIGTHVFTAMGASAGVRRSRRSRRSVIRRFMPRARAWRAWPSRPPPAAGSRR